MNSRGSALIAWLFVIAIFAAVALVCILAAPDPTPLLEQVNNSISNSIGAIL